MAIGIVDDLFGVYGSC